MDLMQNKTYIRGLICELRDENNALNARYERLKYDVFNLLECKNMSLAEPKFNELKTITQQISQNQSQINDLEKRLSAELK